ncbi:TPA: hypothetical protein DDW35_09450 [Candidatus Sumerlaeota bacterium]|jgi:DNA processing protein|nr:hypothetical protein [Candidatus Sumerlaeota bacterium]
MDWETYTINSETVSWYALTFLSGLSWSDVNGLVESWCGNGERSLEDLFRATKRILKAEGLTDLQAQGVEIAYQASTQAIEALQPCEDAKLAVLTGAHPDYPLALANTLGRHRPPMLFCAGNPALFNQPAISIIGARAARRVSLEFTREVAEKVAEKGLLVVSGFAEGVDRAASFSALDAGGSTLVFVPRGLLTFTMANESVSDDERAWFQEKTDKGNAAVVSCFAPRAEWMPARALQRNGLITAMSQDLIVAQSGLSGGSWEASRVALKQKKRVWVREDLDAELGHGALCKLGARPAPWPNAQLDIWVEELVERAKNPRVTGKKTWTQANVVKFLKTATPAEIYETTGITGSLLVRLVEGRTSLLPRSLRDFRKIPGIGESTVQEIAEAFGLSLRKNLLHPSLFPDMEEFENWRDGAPESKIKGTLHSSHSPVVQKIQEDIEFFALGREEPKAEEVKEAPPQK